MGIRLDTMGVANNKKLLIVGGDGYIGRNLVRSGLDEGYNITTISRTKKDTDTSHEHKNVVKKLVVDISDKQALVKTLVDVEIEYVINCAGYVDHFSFGRGGRNVIDQHFNGVLNIVESINKDALKAFIQLGSSDEYGSNKAPQSEDQRELPISPYSLGKTATSHFLQMLHRNENFPATIFRLFLVYGPGQSFDRFIPQTIIACLKDIEFPVSAGTQLRDFCYIDDISDGIIKSLENSKTHGQIINLASGNPVSIKEVVGKIQKLTGGGKPDFGKIPFRPGENMELYANTDKARKYIGWSPEIRLDDGIEQTIEYYKKL